MGTTDAAAEDNSRLWRKHYFANQWTLTAMGRRLRRFAAEMLPVESYRGRCARSLVQRARRVRGRLRHGPASLDIEHVLQENQDRKGIVIFPPFIDWTWMRQRPQHLMTQFARAGYLSLFCSPKNRTDRFEGFVRIEPRLYLCDSLDSLYELPNPILLVNWVLHWNLIKRFRSPRVIYDYLDDLSVGAKAAEPDPTKLDLHHKLAARAEIVLATARRLYDEVRRLRPDAILCPNGVDCEHFRRSTAPAPPSDIADLVRTGRPIIGYYGALAKWFDYDLVQHAASIRKDCHFLLIGPDYDGSINCRSRLLRMSNVRWLGEKRYEELPEYLYHFNVATLPFVINDITKATSPVKLFEYMAGGKPIVTTDMPECREHGCVLVARDAAEYLVMLDEAIHRGRAESYRRLLEKHAQANTWEARLRPIVGQLEICNHGQNRFSA